MAEQIITKRCSKCKDDKSTSEFHKDKSRADGLCYLCKICNNKRLAQHQKTKIGKIARKRHRQSEKGKATHKRAYQKYAANHPERRKAKDAVNNAIKSGKLPQPNTLNCNYCPKQAEQYHHPSYEPEHWLDVIPVCCLCHRKIHSSC